MPKINDALCIYKLVTQEALHGKIRRLLSTFEFEKLNHYHLLTTHIKQSQTDVHSPSLNSSVSSCALMCLTDGLLEITSGSDVWLFDCRKYLQHTQRKREVFRPPTPKPGFNGAAWVEEVMFAIIRQGIKEGTEERRRRMGESGYIPIFGKSDSFLLASWSS